MKIKIPKVKCPEDYRSTTFCKCCKKHVETDKGCYCPCCNSKIK